MADLIDRSVLIPDTEWDEYEDGYVSYSAMQIRNAPTVDAAGDHGHWIKYLESKDMFGNTYTSLYQCSKCKKTNEEDYDFCPYCGAKMGEASE